MVRISTSEYLNWPEIEQILDELKARALDQLVRIYSHSKDFDNYPFKFGDEIEFSLVKFDHLKKKVHLLLKAENLFDVINKSREEQEELKQVEFHKEYTAYMIETIPGEPYDDDINTLCKIQENFKLRRKLISNFLDQDESVLSLTCFPMLGCNEFTWPSYEPSPNGGCFNSYFFPDEAICNEKAFHLATININARRNGKVRINVPIYFDTNTPKPFNEDLPMLSEEEKNAVQKTDHIYMDCGGFGMGCCCIHVTFQTKSLEEVRFVYDQMTPLTPIVLTLSASSPIWRGYLADIDCRWNVIRDAMDDRSQDELGNEPLRNNHFLIRKSRFDTTDTYISRQGEVYNDYEFPFNPKIVEKLKQEGMDEVLAKHFASLFIKDPFIVNKDELKQQQSEDFIGNFEMLLNTNWRMLRLKTPPLKSDETNKLGWRIEFRPTELQLTDFENAAIKTFIILLARAIISNRNVNFLVPISKVDANMQTACKRNACLGEKFYFRKNIYEKDQECQLESMSINEIINGSEHFKGLIPFINEYLNTLENMKPETRVLIENYLKVFEYRASGKLPTPASWMRQFVDRHPKYAHDSKINDEINYDLMNKISQISSQNIDNVESLIENFAK